MAEKELNAILKVRCDSYTNWTNTDPVLKKGEQAIVLVESENADSQPVVLSKVGNGTDKFSLLPWNSANAADVYPWAKTPSKPEYTPEEVGVTVVYFYNVGTDIKTQMSFDDIHDAVYSPLMKPVLGWYLGEEFVVKSCTSSSVVFVSSPTVSNTSDMIDGTIGVTTQKEITVKSGTVAGGTVETNLSGLPAYFLYEASKTNTLLDERVSFTKTQTLTEEQKTTARNNIGAINADESEEVTTALIATTITSSSTNNELAGAKAVYDVIQDNMNYWEPF